MRALAAISGLLVALLVAAAPGDPGAVVGSWHLYAAGPDDTRPDAPRVATLELKLADGALAGAWVSSRGTYPLHDLTFAEGKLSFSFEFDTRGQGTRHMSFAAGVAGDRMLGRLTTPRSNQPVRGERVAPAAPAPPAPAPGT